MERFGDKVQCNPSVKLKKGDSYPLISIDKITVGYKNVSSDDFVKYAGQSGCKFLDNDVLMARITPCLENGKIAVAKTDGGKGIGSTELFVFRGIDNVSDTNYIYYLLCMPYMRNMAINSMTGASGRQRADIGFIKKIPWTFPSLEMQKRIANILSQYDNLIDNNNKRIKILEQMAENLYKEWFVRFRFPGYERAEFVEGVPKGWKRCRLKEFINFNPNYKTEKKQYYTNIPMAALSTNGMYINEAEISLEEKSSGTHFRNGDVLFAKITPCLENGKTGLVTCLKDNEIGVGSTEFIVMQGAKVSSFFTYCIARNDLFRQLAINSMNGADGRQRADISFIQNIKWILPDDEILLKFEHITSAIIKQINILHKQNQNLIKQRDYLLPRLMSGKVQVK